MDYPYSYIISVKCEEDPQNAYNARHTQCEQQHHRQHRIKKGAAIQAAYSSRLTRVLHDTDRSYD